MTPSYEYIRLECDLKRVARLPDLSLPLYEAIVSSEAHKLTQATTSELGTNEVLIAVGARHNGKPAGLAIAALNKILKTAHLRQLFISPEYSQNVVGIALLSKILEELKREKAYLCTFTYIKEDPGTPLLEKTLRQTGWEGPRPFLLRCWFDVETFAPAWLYLPYHYPAGFEEFFWKDLSAEERNDLLAREAQRQFHTAVSPFRYEDKLGVEYSLGLRYQGKVIGWSLTHRIDEETLRYSSLYIDRSFRDKQPAMKLLSKSIVLHKQFPTKWALIEIPYLIVPPHWAQFVKKRLEPIAARTEHILQSWHNI